MVANRNRPQIPCITHRAEHDLVELVWHQQFVVIDFDDEWDAWAYFRERPESRRRSSPQHCNRLQCEFDNVLTVKVLRVLGKTGRQHVRCLDPPEESRDSLYLPNDHVRAAA